MSINQDRGVVAVATPMDKELADLSSQLNTTYVRYGTLADLKAANQAAQDANALRNGTGGGTSRAASKSSGLYRNADWDLVDRLKDDPKFDVKTVPETELCEELKKMKPAEREAHVKAMLARHSRSSSRSPS